MIYRFFLDNLLLQKVYVSDRTCFFAKGVRLGGLPVGSCMFRSLMLVTLVTAAHYEPCPIQGS
jgi:hypothetical protein